jgi:Uma2 family endonuclease
MQIVRPRMSFADLERLPEDGPRFELYDGVLSEVSAPIPRHQRVAYNAAEALKNYERQAGGLMLSSPIDIVLDDYNVVQPDVVFFARDRAGAIDMHRAIRTSPDLAIEVLSRATAAIDRGKKLRLLARFGVGECWLIDPIANTLWQFELAGEIYQPGPIVTAHDVVSSLTLAELTFPAARLFE